MRGVSVASRSHHRDTGAWTGDHAGDAFSSCELCAALSTKSSTKTRLDPIVMPSYTYTAHALHQSPLRHCPVQSESVDGQRLQIFFVAGFLSVADLIHLVVVGASPDGTGHARRNTQARGGIRCHRRHRRNGLSRQQTPNPASPEGPAHLHFHGVFARSRGGSGGWTRMQVWNRSHFGCLVYDYAAPSPCKKTSRGVGTFWRMRDLTNRPLDSTKRKYRVGPLLTPRAHSLPPSPENLHHAGARRSSHADAVSLRPAADHPSQTSTVNSSSEIPCVV